MLCFVNVLLAFDLPTMAELLRLALPVATRMITEWVRPLLFNVFVSLHVKHSYLHGRDAARELDAVGLAIMTLNLLLFASAYGFNGAIDTFTANARISGSGGIRNELLALLQRQAADPDMFEHAQHTHSTHGSITKPRLLALTDDIVVRGHRTRRNLPLLLCGALLLADRCRARAGSPLGSDPAEA